MQRLIENFIKPARRKIILDEMTNTPNIGITSQYNNKEVEIFLNQMTARVGKIFGKDVIETYGYTRHYAYDSERDSLHRHTDRPACEFSLTICLATNCSWPIFVADGPWRDRTLERPNALPYITQPGDAVAYFGCHELHWREKLVTPGAYQTQMFLHYIDKNGPHYPDHAYDSVAKARASGDPRIEAYQEGYAIPKGGK